ADVLLVVDDEHVGHDGMVGEASDDREFDREAAAASDLALEVDPPAVCLHDVAHDREPEAGRAALLALRESLEDPLALSGRDTGAAVFHGEPHGLAGRRERDP